MSFRFVLLAYLTIGLGLLALIILLPASYAPFLEGICLAIGLGGLILDKSFREEGFFWALMGVGLAAMHFTFPAFIGSVNGHELPHIESAKLLAFMVWMFAAQAGLYLMERLHVKSLTAE